jgi:cysteine desulfurase
MIYLDHNATTPLDPEVLEAMLPYLQTFYGNPSGIYRFARIARTALDTAREQLAELVDADPSEVIFTSGGTEANALALSNVTQDQQLFISAIEHPSITENAKASKSPLTFIQPDASGRISAEMIAEQNFQQGDFLSLMLANNETGCIQDIASIQKQISGHALFFHCDAVQALGKIPFSFQSLGVQTMSFSSHKIYGPKGAGALIVSKKSAIRPLLHGGGQEQGLRSGTENVAAIVGFGKAAELAKNQQEIRYTKLQALRDKLEQQLRTIPGVVIFSENAQRLPNTTQFGISGLKGEMLLMQLDRRNIAVSSGSACSATSEQVSPVLAAMGIEPALARSAIRVSLGKDNNEPEVDEFVSVIKTLLIH